MNCQIQTLLRMNAKNKKYFFKKIDDRFSDYIDGRQLHFSKLFEFFEMARFELMEDFYDYYRNKRPTEEDLNLGKFVVGRIQSETYEALYEEIKDEITIKTNLKVRHIPLLEFEQIAYRGKEKLFCANVKVIMVDDHLNKIETWNPNVLETMLEFIESKGKEE